jgi:hypothetical protein
MAARPKNGGTSMGKLRKLQDRYKKGEITKAEYKTELKKLLDEEFIEQDSYDEALEFDPEEGRLIYTQEDMDRTVAKKAAAAIRKALKEAGVEVDASVTRLQDLTAKATEVIKAGIGKSPAADDKELTELRKKAGRADEMDKRFKDLIVENAVLKSLNNEFAPINPVQVVRALRLDYMDLIEIDDEGTVDQKSVRKALRKIADTEPNLFKDPESGSAEEDEENGGQGSQSTKGQSEQHSFSGKPPGGGGVTGTGAKAKEYQANAARAHEILVSQGLIPKEQNK